MAVMDQNDSCDMVPMFRLLTVESPQLQFHPGYRHLFRGAEAVSHGPDRSSDHRCSPVAVQGGRCPCCAILQFSTADVEETVELPQLQLVDLTTGCCMPVVCNNRCRVVRSAETALVPQLQCSDMVSGDFLGPCTHVQGWGSCPQGTRPS